MFFGIPAETSACLKGDQNQGGPKNTGSHRDIGATFDITRGQFMELIGSLYDKKKHDGWTASVSGDFTCDFYVFIYGIVLVLLLFLLRSSHVNAVKTVWTLECFGLSGGSFCCRVKMT